MTAESIKSSGGISVGQSFKYKGKIYRAISFSDKFTVNGMSTTNTDNEAGVTVKISKITRC